MAEEIFLAALEQGDGCRRPAVQSVTLPGSDPPVELHFHDLRGTTVTLLSEAGCTPRPMKMGTTAFGNSRSGGSTFSTASTEQTCPPSPENGRAQNRRCGSPMTECSS